MQVYIQKTLTEHFVPSHLSVINESSAHNVAPGSETHFKVVLVSSAFNEVSAVKRHQAVYKALEWALNNGVHALALHTHTPKEWASKQSVPDSPNCMGGE